MDFIEIYQSVGSTYARRDFRRRICNECDILDGAFFKWLRNERVPYRHQKTIAKLLGKTEQELFPYSFSEKYIFPEQKNNLIEQ